MESIARTARNRGVDVLLPIGYYANVLFARYQHDLGRVASLAIASPEAMSIASDKRQTMALANKVGVPTPRTYASPEEITTFPVVVKAIMGTGAVTYVNSRPELDSLDARHTLIQEYIPGTGFGFYALFNRGKLRALFMHRRIREFPVTGGASTAAAAHYDDRLKAYGTRLLTELCWHGVAMVEMKRDSRDGEYKLMEINPKFWGSLDLAIAAGVNFPYLACRLALDGDVSPVLEYDRSAKFHWPLPYELLHLIARPASARTFVKDLLDPAMKTNLSLSDWGPTFYLAATTPLEVARRAVRRKLFRPHGLPSVS